MDIKYKNKYLKYKKMYNQVIGKDINTEIIQEGGGKTNRMIFMTKKHLIDYFKEANEQKIKKCYKRPVNTNKYSGIIETPSYDDMQNIWGDNNITERPYVMEQDNNEIKNILSFFDERRAEIDNNLMKTMRENAHAMKKQLAKFANNAGKSVLEASAMIPGSDLFCINKVINMVNKTKNIDFEYLKKNDKELMVDMTVDYLEETKDYLLSSNMVNVDDLSFKMEKYPVITMKNNLPTHNNLSTALCKMYLDEINKKHLNNQYTDNEYTVIFYFTMHHDKCNTIDGMYVSSNLLYDTLNAQQLEPYINMKLFDSYNYDNTRRNYMYTVIDEFASGNFKDIIPPSDAELSKPQPNSRRW